MKYVIANPEQYARQEGWEEGYDEALKKVLDLREQIYDLEYDTRLGLS